MGLTDFVLRVLDKKTNNYEAISRSCSVPFGLESISNYKYKSFGDKNPDKMFFVIWRECLGAGMFSNINHVLVFLFLLENTPFIPVVDFKNFKTLYNEDQLINETENSWEYYFKQVSDYSLDEIYQSKNVFFCDGKFPEGRFLPKFEDKYYYKKMKELFNPQDYIQELVKKFDKEFENNRVLGVHFRGQAMNISRNHGYGPTIEQMFKNTDEIIEKFNIDKIFVSTEDQGYLEAYIKRYGNKVFYADTYRTKYKNAYNIRPRENHMYLMGLEVLIDTILIMKCNGMLYGNSSITNAIKGMDEKFEFTYQIFNGINSNNRLWARFSYRIKKLLPAKFGGLKNEVIIDVKEDLPIKNKNLVSI